MPVGFGFSVGDFIAAIDLVSTVVDALRSSGNATAAYRELLNELSTLEAALIRVNQIELDPSQTADQLALNQAAAQCQDTIEAFWTKIQMYQPHLRKGGSSSKIKDGWMKIRWALCKDEDLEIFKAELQGHTGAIELLLLALQMKKSALEAQKQDKQLKSLAGNIQDLSFQWMGKFCSMTTSITSCLSQGNQLLSLTAQVLRTNLQVFQMVLNIHNFIMQIPGQVMRQQPVYFWDARGFFAPFHLEFIDSSEAFLAVLKVRFQDVGFSKITRGEFSLSDAHTKRDINFKWNWNQSFRPGQTVHMSMIFALQQSTERQCPACATENDTTLESEVKCAYCGICYRQMKTAPLLSDGSVVGYPEEKPDFATPSDQLLLSQTQPAVEMSHENIADYARVRIIPQATKSDLQSFLPGLLESVPDQQATEPNQHQFPRLNDALSYLDQVKVYFSDRPDLYMRFLDTMKDFKEDVIDTPGVMMEAYRLFSGDQGLLEGFNTFLPPGYHVSANVDHGVMSYPDNTATILHSFGKKVISYPDNTVPRPFDVDIVMPGGRIR